RRKRIQQHLEANPSHAVQEQIRFWRLHHHRAAIWLPALKKVLDFRKKSCCAQTDDGDPCSSLSRRFKLHTVKSRGAKQQISFLSRNDRDDRVSLFWPAIAHPVQSDFEPHQLARGDLAKDLRSARRLFFTHQRFCFGITPFYAIDRAFDDPLPPLW